MRLGFDPQKIVERGTDIEGLIVDIVQNLEKSSTLAAAHEYHMNYDIDDLCLM
jgi:hypothetical protein